MQIDIVSFPSTPEQNIPFKTGNKWAQALKYSAMTVMKKTIFA